MPGSRRSEFAIRAIRVIRSIPRGRVATYGGVAAAAGNPGAARGVVWVLHSSSRAERLPWHRVVAAGGRIALGEGSGGDLQRALLEREGVGFGMDGRVDMQSHEWSGRAGRY